MLQTFLSIAFLYTGAILLCEMKVMFLVFFFCDICFCFEQDAASQFFGMLNT